MGGGVGRRVKGGRRVLGEGRGIVFEGVVGDRGPGKGVGGRGNYHSVV